MSSRRRARKMRSIAKTWHLTASACLLGAVCGMPGCATSDTYRDVRVPAATMQAYLRDKPAALRPAYRRILREGERNLVLNHLRAGLDAMLLEEWGTAERSLDEALLHIEGIYANNEKAAKARSLWYEEGSKDFRGEPYERAMAFFYRGLLYLRSGDFENARASFKSGALQDAFAEEDQHRCDFALLIFLEGWASQLAGDASLADEAYNEVKRLRPDLKRPAQADNVLVLVETGTSPRKVADGIGHSELKYRRGRHFTDKRARLTLGGVVHDLYPIEDVAWQAMTRGGRVVDRIVKGKAVFRRQQEQAATTLTDISSTAMIAAPLFHNATSEIQGVSAALGLVGVAQYAVAMRARPRADTRYWNNLPDSVHVVTLKLAPGRHSLDVHFLDDAGRRVPTLRRQKEIVVGRARPTVIWLRSRPGITAQQ